MFNLLFEWREQTVKEDKLSWYVLRLCGTKGDRAVFVFGGSIYPGSLCAVKGELFSVQRKKVLAKELSQVLKNIPKAAYDWVVAPYRLSALANV